MFVLFLRAFVYLGKAIHGIQGMDPVFVTCVEWKVSIAFGMKTQAAQNIKKGTFIAISTCVIMILQNSPRAAIMSRSAHLL